MRGQSYKVLKKNDEGKFHFSECKSARKIKPRCNSTFCIKNSKSRKCPFIKEEDREKLFKTFWKTCHGAKGGLMCQLYVLYSLPKLTQLGTMILAEKEL